MPAHYNHPWTKKDPHIRKIQLIIIDSWWNFNVSPHSKEISTLSKSQWLSQNLRQLLQIPQSKTYLCIRCYIIWSIETLCFIKKTVCSKEVINVKPADECRGCIEEFQRADQALLSQEWRVSVVATWIEERRNCNETLIACNSTLSVSYLAILRWLFYFLWLLISMLPFFLKRKKISWKERKQYNYTYTNNYNDRN